METLVSGVQIELNSKQIMRLLPNVAFPGPNTAGPGTAVEKLDVCLEK